MAREAGVHTPKVYKVDTSGDNFSEAYMISERLQGESGNEVVKDMTEQEKLEIYKKLGAEMKKLHSVHIPGFGRQRSGVEIS